MIGAAIFYENSVLEQPKQLEISGKGNYCCIPKMHSMIKIAKRRIGMEKFCERNLWKNLFLVSFKHIACYFTDRELLFQRFLWNFLKLLGRLLFRTSFGGYYLCSKTSKEQSDSYLLTGKMLQHTIIFVNILQLAYRNLEICFLFGKYESLRREICAEFSFKTMVEECRFSSDFPDILLQLHNVKNFS